MTKSVKQILKDHNLNWEVEKRQFLYDGGNGNKIESDYFGLIRTDNDACLGHCKGSYFVAQNEFIARQLKQFGDKHGFEVAKAGYFNGGKKVFFQLRVPNKVKIGGDQCEQYIFAANSFDHSCKLSFGYTNVVISCSNTFNMALRQSAVRFKHTTSAEQRIELELEPLFEEHFDLRNETNKMFNEWSGIEIDKSIKRDLIAYLTGTDKMMTHKEREELSTRRRNIVEALEDSIDKEINAKGDTLWGLFNGVTYYVNHEKSHPRRENGKMESILVGTGNKMMQDAMKRIETVYA